MESKHLQKRSRPLKHRLAMVVASALLSLLVAEVCLRLAGYGSDTSRYVYDAECGARLVPNYSGLQSNEGHAWVTTNAHGFRDREHDVAKPDDVFRIAVLGDSFAEAAQVDLEETFWSVLESGLVSAECFPETTVEVLNFGVSGYGTAQELHMYRSVVKQFAPDLVLLCFLPGNDVRNNSPEIETEKDRPFYQLADGQLVVDNSFRDNATRMQFEASRWLQFKDALVTYSRVVRLVYDARNRRGAQDEKPRALESGIEDAAFFPPRNDVWQRAWDITDALILQMQKEVQDSGSHFALITLNNAIQVHPDPQKIKAFAENSDGSDLSWPDEHLSELARIGRFPCWQLTPRMREIAQKNGLFFHGFDNTALGSGHWNEDGHRVAGELLAHDICQWRQNNGTFSQRE